MLSLTHILQSVKAKQLPLPKSFYEDDPLQIESKEKYSAHLASMNEDGYSSTPLKEKESEKNTEKNTEKNATLHSPERESNKTTKPVAKLVKTYDVLMNIFGDHVRTSYVHSKSNQSLSYRFLDSLFSMIDLSFLSHRAQEKEYIFTQWIKRLDHELMNEQRYYEFNYPKNRNIKREHLLLALNQALTYKCEYDIFDTFIQYNVDMMNMSLIILNMKNRNIDYTDSKVFHYKNIMNPLNPLGIMIYDNGIFYPLLKGDDSPYSLYDFENMEDQERMKRIYKYMNYNDFAIPVIKKEAPVKDATLYDILGEEKDKKKYNPYELEKKKLEELRALCESLSLPIKKRSEKTGRDIYQSKSELIQTICNV